MLRKLETAAMLICMVSYAAAGTVSIGTASARGDMRVDSYTVKDNATLFDGSVVETGQASADLRLQKGVEITMSTNSRATLYRSRMVLEQGETELIASGPFELEASDLRVTPDGPGSQCTVSLKPGNTVEVAALTGVVGVTNDHGVLLARVLPGRTISFAMQQGENSSAFKATGTISFSNGHYFLTVEATGVKYEVVGVDLAKQVGKFVTIVGNIDANATPADGAAAVVDVQNSRKPGGGAMTTGAKTGIVSGIIVAVGVGTGVGIYESNQTTTPASR